MGKALALLLAAIAAGLMVYWLAGPKRFGTRPLAPTTSASSPLHSTSASEASTDSTPPAPSPDKPSAADDAIPAPQTASQKAHEELEAKRKPYYDWVHEQAGDLISDIAPAEEDGSILTIYLSTADSSVVMPLVDKVVAPQAYHYGFRHVRFYLPNPAGSADRYSLYAESTADAEGTWHTYLK